METLTASESLPGTRRKRTYLTARETQVVRYVAAGYQYKQIARELGVSLSVIKLTLERARDVTGARNKENLVALCWAKGWIK